MISARELALDVCVEALVLAVGISLFTTGLAGVQAAHRYRELGTFMMSVAILLTGVLLTGIGATMVWIDLIK